eukprot:10369879-Karenia_brevis.AAC.1
MLYDVIGYALAWGIVWFHNQRDCPSKFLGDEVLKRLQIRRLLVLNPTLNQRVANMMGSGLRLGAE